MLQRVLLPPLDPGVLLYPGLPHDALGRVDVGALPAGDRDLWRRAAGE